jgi:hypothetical protein
MFEMTPAVLHKIKQRAHPTRASDHDIGAAYDQIPFDRVALVPSTPLVSEQIAAPEGDEHQRTTGDAQ